MANYKTILSPKKGSVNAVAQSLGTAATAVTVADRNATGLTDIKELLDSMFEVVNGKIRAKMSLYTDGSLSALGMDSTADGSVTGVSYPRMDSWTENPEANAVLSASLGKSLHDDVEALKTGKSDKEHTHDQYLTANDIANKVDKVTGKGLSTYDYDAAEKQRITDLETFKKNHKDYTLPAAKTDKLGGVKIGANISIADDGTISTHDKFEHPTQTTLSQTVDNGKVISSVSVNTLGHVTEVTQKTLVEDDIPTLSEGKVKGLTNKLTNITKKLDDHKHPIDKIEGLGNALLGITTNATTLQSTVEDMGLAVQGVSERVDTNTNDINTNKGNIQTNASNITKLGDRVTTIEGSYAKSADLDKHISNYNSHITDYNAFHSTFTDMFELTDDGTKIKVKKSLFSVGSISALGNDNTASSVGGGGGGYPRIDSWTALQSGDTLSVPQAKLVKDSLDGKANKVHTHPYIGTDGTGLTKNLVEKVLTGDITSHEHDSVYAPKVHDHNDTYYTEGEIEDKLNQKVNVSDVGNVSGQIAVNFSFPDYHTLGTPGGQNEVYFKTLLKWLKAKYPTRELRFSGLCRPGTLGSLTLIMYNEAANADGIPQYCSGYYVSQNTNRGVIFGYNNYQWYYKQQAAFEDIAWGNLTGKPSNFTPSTHSHTKSEITDFAHDHNNTYLGIEAKATDSAKLDGQLPSYYAKAADLIWSKIGSKPTTVGELGLTNFKVGYYEGKLDDIPTNGLYRLGEASVVPDLPYSSLNSQWSTLLHLCPTSDEKAQILVSYLDSTMYVRGGGTNSWRRWTKILSDNNYTEYAPKKTDYDAFVSAFNKAFTIADDGSVTAKVGLSSLGWLSAKGTDSTSVGGSGASYGRIDAWSDLANTDTTSVPQAKLVKDSLDGKANKVHTHPYIGTDGTGLTKNLVEKVLTGDITSHEHDSVYAPKVHDHNDTYYTEGEIEDKLNQKVNVSDVGNVSGQIAVNFSFPDYHTLGTPGGQNEVYFKTLLKWLKAKYPTRELRFSGLCRPGTLGSLTLIMYNEAANADGIPQYCSGYYVSQNTNRGVIFGYNNYQWYYKQQAAFEDIAWGNLTGKPSNFTPSTHSHTKSEITDFAHDHNNTYLGINATAKDSAKLGGKLPSAYALEHNHPYLPLNGDALMTGPLQMQYNSKSLSMYLGNGSEYASIATTASKGFHFAHDIYVQPNNTGNVKKVATQTEIDALQAKITDLEAQLAKFEALFELNTTNNTVKVKGDLSATGSVSSLA